MMISAPALAFDVTIINQYNVPDSSLRVVSSEPHSGQILETSPQAVTITFTRGVRSERSYIKVTDMYGTQMTDGSVEITDVSMSAALPPLAPGTYRVKWKARCQCNDQKDISDSFKFTVRGLPAQQPAD